MAEKILEYENNFIANLNEKCKKEPLSKEEQKVLKELLVNTILYGNTKVDKDTLAIFVHKYVLFEELFSPSDLLLYTQHLFNFLNENQGNNIALTFTYTDAIMEARKTPNNGNTIKIDRAIFESNQTIQKKNFYKLLMEITFCLLHETFHIRQFEYLTRVENIEQEELFNDLLIATNRKEYIKYHDSLLMERQANEYAINNLPYVLQKIVPEKKLISYQNRLRRKIKQKPSLNYIERQEQLIQEAKEKLTPENVKKLRKTYEKKINKPYACFLILSRISGSKFLLLIISISYL